MSLATSLLSIDVQLECGALPQLVYVGRPLRGGALAVGDNPENVFGLGRQGGVWRSGHSDGGVKAKIGAGRGLEAGSSLCNVMTKQWNKFK